MRIELPWPDKHLSPNARIHWAAKARYKKEAHEEAYFLAWQVVIDTHEWMKVDTGYSLSLTFCPPDRRRRDLDNIEAACKAAFDGMCAGLGIDDSQIIETSKRWGEVVKGGAVIVEIEEVK